MEVGGTTGLRRALPQILAVNAKNILLLGYGLTLGFPTIVIPSVMATTGNTTDDPRRQDALRLSLDQISWFSSINLLCVPVGCLLSGMLTQPFGRKPSMMALNIPFIAAWLMFHFADTVVALYAALAVTGLAGGLLESPVLTYVAEITEPRLRGVLSAMSSMCVILGVFLQFLLGTLMHWRSVALLNIAFPLAALLAISFVPESPHWLVGRGRTEDAEKSLMWLRGWVEAEEVKAELLQLEEAVNKEMSGKKSAFDPRAYTRGTFLRPYGVVTLVFFLGHFGGMTTLQTFAVGIFAALGSPIDNYSSTVVIGLVELLGAMLCMLLVKRTGKRPLALASTGGGAVCFLLVGLYSALSSSGRVPELPWFPLVGLVSAAFAMHVCLRLLPWMLIGEVFTADVRPTASGASAGIGYVLGFATNKSYLYIVGLVDVWGALVLYGAVGILGVVALYLFLPETEGLTLREVQEHFEKSGEAEERMRKREMKGQWAASNPAAVDLESHL